MGRTKGVVGAVALLGSLLACGDNDGAGDGGDDSDGGGVADASGAGDDSGVSSDSGVTFDSGVAFDSGVSVDGSTADGGADAGSGLVTFTFAVQSQELSGRPVFFLRPDYSVVDVVVTDAEGHAEAVFDETGIVALHWDLPGTGEAVWAYLSVPPGSDIVLGGQSPESAATLIVNGPSYPGASFYGVRTPCGSNSGSRTPTVTIGLAFCNARTHLLWVAYLPDGQGGFAEQVVYVPEVSIAAGTVSVQGQFHSTVEQTTTVTGIPAVVTYAYLQYGIVSPYGSVADGVGLDVYPSRGVISTTDTLPDLVGERGLYGHVQGSLTRLTGPQQASDMYFYATRDHEAAPIVDLSDEVIPWVSDPTFDGATGTLGWTEDGGGSADIAVGTVMAYSDPFPRYWLLMAPHTGTALVVPRLPEPFGYLNIDRSTTVQGRIEISAQPGGYASYMSNGPRYGGVPGDTTIVSSHTCCGVAPAGMPRLPLLRPRHRVAE